MSFFNKKEDVMKIELTPHGRYLLMKGQLKPQYYSFFDDDILYDSEAAGFTENNADTKIRILSQTPSIKPQVTHRGIESNAFNEKTTDEYNVLINPIGTNKTISKDANGWDISALDGEFVSSKIYISSSTSPMYNVPQVECELNFTMSVTNIDEDVYFDEDYESSDLAPDDTFIKLEKEDYILYILEKNGFLYKDSLSLEVFRYDYDEVNMNKIMFFDEHDPNNSIETHLEFDDENIVETFFNISFDRQIPNSDLCKGLKKLKDTNIYLGLNIQCDDIIDPEINIYQTDVTDMDIEDCD